MNKMLETLAVEVTDEKTMLREKLDEARAQLSLTERQLEAANRDLSAMQARNGQLVEENKDTHRLLDMMTAASARKGKELDAEQAWHDRELTRLAKQGEKREMYSAIAGFIAGCVSSGLMLAIVYLVR